MVNAGPTPIDRDRELMMMNSFAQAMFIFKNRIRVLKLMGIPRGLLLAEMRALEARAILLIELVWHQNQRYWIGRIFEEDPEAEIIRQALTEIEELRNLIDEEFPGVDSRLSQTV